MKNILITGATSGIGRSILEELIQREQHTAFCGRSEEKIRQITDNLDPAKHFSAVLDITEISKIPGFFIQAENAIGPIDVLINCAGANTARGFIDSVNEDDLLYMYRLNCLAPIIFMREAVRSMKIRQQGLIINILSSVCLFSNEGLSGYTASKAAFAAAAGVVRKEVRKEGIRVCSVYPGGVNTEFRPNTRPEYLSPMTIAKAVLNIIQADPSVCYDEVVIRPLSETNFK